MEIRKGVLKAFDSGTYKATVQVVGSLAVWLAGGVPFPQAASLLHNDYKLDNCQFDPGDPDRVTSIFDWDMATLGDPLTDLEVSADLDFGKIYPVGRRPQDARRIPLRQACIRLGGAFPDHPPEEMSPHGLHDSMAI